MARWHFRAFSPGDNISDPEFTKALFSGDTEASMARSLVREAIQNSLDAKRHDADIVTVKIGLYTRSSALDPRAIEPFLAGIWDHISTESAGLSHPIDRLERVPFLTLEDFGTHGLRGDPEHWKPTGISRNAFFLFFRALGRSGKEGEDRGRWGVGKFVFPMAGRAHMMWGLSVPSDSSQSLLMGRVVLKTHQVGDDSYHPDGHYGTRRDTGSKLVSPIRDEQLIARFASTFQLKRGADPGLSVVVPWVLEEIRIQDIERSVIGEYFLPLLRKQLRVVLSEAGHETVVDEVAVTRFAEETDDAVLKARLKLASAVVVGRSHGLEWPQLFSYQDSEWRSDAAPKPFLEGLRDLLERGEPVSIRVGTTVRLREPDCELMGSFHIHMQHVDSVGGVRPLIVREGISVSADRTRSLQDHVALIVADDGPVATMLGDAETPAHEELKHALIKDRYVYAKKGITFIREAPSDLLRMVWQADRSDDPLLLSGYFPILGESGRTGEQPMAGKRGREPEPKPIIPRSPPRYHVTRLDDGFRVRHNPDNPSRAPELSVVVAYDVRRGSPFKRYRVLDFNLASNAISVNAVGCEISSVEGNRMIVRPVEDNFQVDVTGFDSRRDLIVRVSPAGVEQ